MSDENRKSTGKREIYYYLSFGITGLLLIAGSIIYKLFLQDRVWLSECLIYKLTGVYCPACGGTRAVMSLLDGRVMESLFYHPVVLYAALLWIAYIGINTMILLWTHGREKMVHITRKYVLVGLLLLLINFIMKNI